MTGPFIGNARAVAAVQRALAGGTPPHAWLFVGPESVGKATLVLWLAQAVNCEEQGASSKEQGGAVEPCGVCGQCVRIGRGIHADVSTVSILPPEDGVQHKEISVDQVREVERAVALAPFEGRTRVVIIDPADGMSTGAQNAILKTLEEPPPNAVFVLIATGEGGLLPTVRSRCRRIEFGLVPASEIDEALVRRGGDSEQARLLARLASGRPGRAIEMADNPSRLEKRREALEQASALGGMAMGDLMDVSERLANRFRDDRQAVLGRLAAWLSYWRDVLLTQSGAEDGIGNIDMLDQVRGDAQRYDAADTLAFVEALLECRGRLEANVQARIALDALVAQAPRVTAIAGR